MQGNYGSLNNRLGPKLEPAQDSLLVNFRGERVKNIMCRYLITGRRILVRRHEA
jgi:hypothetical protein